MCLYSKKSSSTARPRIRPWPLCLNPPSSNWSESAAQPLIQTVPASSARAARNGRSALLVIDAPDRAAAEAFVAGDPYGLAGLFDRVTIHGYRAVFKDGQQM